MNTPLQRSVTRPRPQSVQPWIQFIDIEEFAGILGVSSRTIRRMMKRGELPRVFYFGDLPRWLLSDIEKWIDGRGDDPGPVLGPDNEPPDAPTISANSKPSGSDAQPAEVPVCVRCGAPSDKETCPRCGYRRCPSCGDR